MTLLLTKVQALVFLQMCFCATTAIHTHRWHEHNKEYGLDLLYVKSTV